MSAIRVVDPSFAVELKLFQLQKQLGKTSPSSISRFPIIFKELSDEVSKADTPGKLRILFTVIEKNKLLEKLDDSKQSPNFLFYALKSIQYGLTQNPDKKYKASWKDLSQKNLKEKIEKLQKKVASAFVIPDQEEKQSVNPPSKGSELEDPELDEAKENLDSSLESPPDDVKEKPLAFSDTWHKETPDEPSKKLIDRVKGSFSKAKSKFMRPRVNSTPALMGPVIPPPSKPSRRPVFDIFPKENPTEAPKEIPKTLKIDAKVATTKEETEEVFFWEAGFFGHVPKNPPEILLKFQKEVMESLHEKGSKYLTLLENIPTQQRDRLEDCVSIYLDEIFFRVEESLNQFEDAISSFASHSEIFKRNFVASSFLVHLYHTSLLLDKVYIEKSWDKPALVESMQTALHLEKPLLQLLPKIDKMPVLAGSEKKIRHAESALAYQHLRKQKKTKWLTLQKFEEAYAGDPLSKSGLGHRPSFPELPKWIATWLIPV